MRTYCLKFKNFGKGTHFNSNIISPPGSLFWNKQDNTCCISSPKKKEQVSHYDTNESFLLKDVFAILGRTWINQVNDWHHQMINKHKNMLFMLAEGCLHYAKTKHAWRDDGIVDRKMANKMQYFVINRVLKMPKMKMYPSKNKSRV